MSAQFLFRVRSFAFEREVLFAHANRIWKRAARLARTGIWIGPCTGTISDQTYFGCGVIVLDGDWEPEKLFFEKVVGLRCGVVTDNELELMK
jgi:hypothetical protein